MFQLFETSYLRPQPLDKRQIQNYSLTEENTFLWGSQSYIEGMCCILGYDEGRCVSCFSPFVLICAFFPALITSVFFFYIVFKSLIFVAVLCKSVLLPSPPFGDLNPRLPCVAGDAAFTWSEGSAASPGACLCTHARDDPTGTASVWRVSAARPAPAAAMWLCL